MRAREFHLAELIALSDGHLVRKWEDVVDLASFLTGEEMSTMGMMASADVLRRAVLSQHPFLAKIKFPNGIRGEEITTWLDDRVAQFGEYFQVVSIADMPRMQALNALVPSQVTA